MTIPFMPWTPYFFLSISGSQSRTYSFFTDICFTIFLYVWHNDDTYTHSLPTMLFHTTGLDYPVGTHMYLSSLLAHRGWHR